MSFDYFVDPKNGKESSDPSLQSLQQLHHINGVVQVQGKHSLKNKKHIPNAFLF
jgi:hypothetical protein